MKEFVLFFAFVFMENDCIASADCQACRENASKRSQSEELTVKGTCCSSFIFRCGIAPGLRVARFVRR